MGCMPYRASLPCFRRNVARAARLRTHSGASSPPPQRRSDWPKAPCLGKTQSTSPRMDIVVLSAARARSTAISTADDPPPSTSTSLPWKRSAS